MKPVFAVLLFVALVHQATGDLVRKNTFVNELMTWTDAQLYCRRWYVDLATVNTLWELLKFEQDLQAETGRKAWVGLSKQSFDPVYTQWSDRSAVGLPLWEIGYPNNLVSHHCVLIWDLLLNDCSCERRLPFVCYKWAPHMVLVEEMLSWEEALRHCRTHYTDLISVSTDKELNSARSASANSSTPAVWTGLRFMDGSWFWVSSNPLGNLTSLPSCPMEPNHCGALTAGGDVWENRDCEEKMKFLCLY